MIETDRNNKVLHWPSTNVKRKLKSLSVLPFALLLSSFTLLLIRITKINSIFSFISLLGFIICLSLLIIGLYLGKQVILKAIIIIPIIYAGIFSIPLQNGYQLLGSGGADVLMHMGIVKQILVTGHIPPSDWYPYIHIILAIFKFFGLSDSSSTVVLSSISVMLFLLGFYLYVRRDVSSKVNIKLAVAAVPIFTFGYLTTQPAILSILLAPMIVWGFNEYSERGGIPFLSVLIVLLFSLALYHPVSFLFVVLMVIIEFQSSRSRDLQNQFAILSCVLVAYIYWYSSSYRITLYLSHVIGVLSGHRTSPAAAQTANVGSGSFFQVVQHIFLWYGPILIIGFFAAIYTAWSFYCSLTKDQQLTRYTFQYLTGLFVGIIFFFNYLIGFSPLRIARYAAIFALAIYGEFIQSTRGLIRTFLIVVVLVMIIAGGVSILQPSDYMTKSEAESLDWTYFHSSEQAVVYSVGISDDTGTYLGYEKRLFGRLGEYQMNQYNYSDNSYIYKNRDDGPAIETQSSPSLHKVYNSRDQILFKTR